MTITNANDVIALEAIDQQNAFILIDLQCKNSLDILLNADKKLQNNYWIILNMNATQVGIFKANHSNAFKLIGL